MDVPWISIRWKSRIFIYVVFFITMVIHRELHHYFAMTSISNDKHWRDLNYNGSSINRHRSNHGAIWLAVKERKILIGMSSMRNMHDLRKTNLRSDGYITTGYFLPSFFFRSFLWKKKKKKNSAKTVFSFFLLLFHRLHAIHDSN